MALIRRQWHRWSVARDLVSDARGAAFSHALDEKIFDLTNGLRFVDSAEPGDHETLTRWVRPDGVFWQFPKPRP